MKAKDIKSFETGNTCFNDILQVNGKDYEDIREEEVLEFILDMFENDVNGEIFLREVFEAGLEYLQHDCVEDEASHCDQCGSLNHYRKFVE